MTNRANFHKANRPGKPVVARSKNSLTFDMGGYKQTVCAAAPLHKGAGPFTDADEIDTAWQTTTGAWDYIYDKADFKVEARDTFNVGNLFQYTDPASGEIVQFDPQSLSWIDENTSRQQIAIKQAVTAQVNDYILSFPNAWGTGRHFQYEAAATRLAKLITIDSASNLPAVTLQGSQVWFEAEFALSMSSGLDAYIDGVKWAKANNVRIQTNNAIEFRDAATGTVVIGKLPTPFAWDSATDPNETRSAQYEVRRQGGPSNLFITLRIPKTWIDAATFPIYIDPTFGPEFSDAGGDGRLVSSGSTSWAASHAGDSLSANNTITTLRVRSQESGGTYWEIIRNPIPFDTSGIPDTDDISAATVDCYGTGGANDDNDGDDYYAIVQSSQASPTTLATSDFSLMGSTELSDQLDFSALSSGAYNTWTLNAAGLALIDKTGYTQLCLREGHDILDHEVVGNSTYNFYSADQTSTSQDPYLTVTHAPSGRIMGSLAGPGGLAGIGGIAGQAGGLAG